MSDESSNEKQSVSFVELDDSEKRPQCFNSLFQEIICILCCTLSVGAANVTTGYCMLSLSKISEAFDVIGGDLTWATGSVGLGCGSFLLIMGGISDSLGRKRTMLASFVLFAIMHLISGFCNDYIGLCIVRALAGAFISAGTPSLAGILGANYQLGKRKNRALAGFSAGAPIGLIAGLIIGGVSSEVLSWRAGHWFMAIVYAVLVPITMWSAPLDEKLNRQQTWSILKKLDYVGSFISLSGFTLFCFALTQAGSEPDGFKTPYILATFIIGFFLIVGLGFYEAYVPSMPIMPMQIWKKRNFSLSMVLITLCWINFQGVLVYYSVIYFEEVLNYSPLHTAACVLTMGIAGICVNIFAAFTLHLIPGTLMLAFACACFATSAIIWETMSIHRNYWLGPFWAYIISVMGADLVYNVVNMVTLTSVDASLQSSALGIFNTLIQLSGTLGLGISSAAVSARYEYYGTELELEYPERLFDSFKNAYWIAFGCAILALFICPFIKIGTLGNHKKMDPDVTDSSDASSTTYVC